MKTLKLGILGLCLFSCVQETHLKTITFKLDMTGIEDIDEVGVKGSFTTDPWNETFKLNDENNDGIYEGTFIETSAANQIEFKFVNKDNNYELQGLENRIITYIYQPETLIYYAIFDDKKGKLVRIE